MLKRLFKPRPAVEAGRALYAQTVAQARNPLLPVEQSVWWYWSRQRKAARACR